MLKPDEDDNLLDTYEVMPMIHCHCFTREMDPEKAEVDIRKVRLSFAPSFKV